jgi:hypothetical protein
VAQDPQPINNNDGVLEQTPARQDEGPPDVFLNVENLEVDRILLTVRNLRAPHLQELALPVFEDGFDEVSASQILDVTNRRLPVLLLGAVVVQEARDALRGHKDEE